MIPFNKPYLSGNELQYIGEAVQSGKISGNGVFTKKCQQFFEEKYGFRRCLLTTSCTDALEMAAILCDIQVGDEVIVPSYTFVSTANAFVLRGAKIVFADSSEENPNLDATKLASLITSKTKAIVVVHYAGIACDMDAIMAIAKKHQIYVIEDAAQAIDSFYKGRALGSIGHLSAFSFHETKNIISGEGGMLVINDERFEKRAEIIWEKGTNRSAFWRGEVDKYNWVDIGSSFLPSEVVAAYLYAQLENLEKIQARRKQIWDNYFTAFKALADKGKLKLPVIPVYATNNAHMFYLLTDSIEQRDALITYLKENKIYAVFHYISLHSSPFYQEKAREVSLPMSDYYSDCLVRLPLFYELSEADQQLIIEKIIAFYN
ncbi:TDP-4-keto-6-deoxy-D-glucose transaminase [Emticicia oligotrophica DSM 17448]|uniref:TDP-4-keto-6-deoxy-D-glucose transaminase n=1 Tax=Emticicia oligotrophica (strain DSM 17448 / CIP 109782 / MTCC 6937 / GPTSA100-15) TaxID=929562 RepID=A0ABM5N4J3_EMTOG|nr:dTDP-4-amino-4,6-dideoxygalactose transaminase [Emticicia oligotrophica]AFK04286.1 TDP-4-keto-6-deoxy-D-glucose transaminase [Emticicia oligotrophica DSM 17448]